MKTNLDIFLEKPQAAGQVELCGETYELLHADIMENFLSILAMKDAISERFTALEQTGDSTENQSNSIVREMDELRTELRRMIRILVPGLPEDIIRDKFPKLEQLLAVFKELLNAAMESLPDSVKKNSVSGPEAEATAR